ncbi:MAG TPA: hypothetical protein VF050_05495 [Moraxellaceae bacterium]
MSLLRRVWEQFSQQWQPEPGSSLQEYQLLQGICPGLCILA